MAANHLSSTERAAHGRVGGFTANADPSAAVARAARAREGQRQRWAALGREAGLTDPDAIAAFVARKLDAHMAAMVAKSLKARRQAKAAKLREQADALEALADENTTGSA